MLVTPERSTTSAELFEQGQTELRQGRPRHAAELFDFIVQHDGQSPWAPRAYLQAGLAWEQVGDLARASERFEELARRHPAHREARGALLRALRVRLHLGQWSSAAAVAETLLGRGHRPHPSELVLASAAQALSALEQGDRELSQHLVGKGLAVVDRLGLDRAGRIPRDVAPLYFAQGEVRRQQALELRILHRPQGFAQRLEERCQMLLAAQSSYSDAMRAYDAHWSARAGLRVGKLYEELHEELVAVPPPTSVQPDRQALFEGAMRLRYSILLHKAEAMAEHTLALLQRADAEPLWVEQAQSSLQSIRQGREREDAALDALPHSRAALRAALEELERRASQHPPSPHGPSQSDSSKSRSTND